MISDKDLVPDHPYIELKGFTHIIRMYASFKDYLDRDTQIAMLELNDGHALLDLEDIEAIHEWSGFLIEQRRMHELAEAES